MHVLVAELLPSAVAAVLLGTREIGSLDRVGVGGVLGGIKDGEDGKNYEKSI